MLEFIFSNIVYVTAVIVFCCGLFIILSSDHYAKKIIGLSLFQSSVLIFFIALGKISTGKVPVLAGCLDGVGCDDSQNLVHVFSSPLPHVLMLTAIVVGFATISVALALLLRIKQEYNTLSTINIRDTINGQH